MEFHARHLPHRPARGLEATLVVSILIAFLVRSDRRDRLVQVRAGVGLAEQPGAVKPIAKPAPAPVPATPSTPAPAPQP